MLVLGLLCVLLIELLDCKGLFFELHSSILKPDLELSLSELKPLGHFNPPSSCDVLICVKLLLQLKCLITGVSLTASPPESIGSRE